jgi:hypothetical protein
VARGLSGHLPRRQLKRQIPDPEKRIVVGYVSSDFRSHSAGLAFVPVLRNHDRREFEIICYSCSPLRDGVTKECQFICRQLGRGLAAFGRRAGGSDSSRQRRYPRRPLRPFGGQSAHRVRAQARAHSDHSMGKRDWHGSADHRLFPGGPGDGSRDRPASVRREDFRSALRDHDRAA